MSAVTDSDDDDYLNEQFLRNQFEICRVPALTTLFECVVSTDRVTSTGTFASTPLHALHEFLRQNPRHPADVGVRLSVSSALRAFHVYDLDPLQYTRAYSDDTLSLYVGANGKVQRKKVLHEIYAELCTGVRERRIELDALTDLSCSCMSKCGFQWSLQNCMEEVRDLCPVLAGLHHCAQPENLFDPRLLTLWRMRVKLHEHGVIYIGPAAIRALRSAPLHYPPPRLWALDTPEMTVACMHNAGQPEPTGFTSLHETGYRRLGDLRNTLLAHVHESSLERHNNEQVTAYTALLDQCAAFTNNQLDPAD